jgi:hypothetical protein
VLLGAIGLEGEEIIRDQTKQCNDNFIICDLYKIFFTVRNQGGRD